MNLMLHGESGCGKTWLYKHFFENNSIYYEIINLGDAARHKSIEAELKLRLESDHRLVQTAQAEELDARAAVPFISGGAKAKKEYKVPEKDWYLATLAKISESANGSPAYLVFDNLESASRKQEIVEEIANLVLLVDDSRYAKYNVKLLLVGVPSSAREFFSAINDGAPVSNRILELPEVSRLTNDECVTLVRKGFVYELRYVIPDHVLYYVASRAAWVTDGIPQRLHEFCLQLARLTIERRYIYLDSTKEIRESDSKGLGPGKARQDDLEAAQIAWAREALSSDYITIENCVARVEEASRERRLQLLFCIGMLRSREFTLGELRNELRQNFPNKIPKPDRVRIDQHLNDLQTSPHRILKMNMRRDKYVLFEPRHRVLIRAIIARDPDTEEVALKKLDGGSIVG